LWVAGGRSLHTAKGDGTGARMVASGPDWHGQNLRGHQLPGGCEWQCLRHRPARRAKNTIASPCSTRPGRLCGCSGAAERFIRDAVLEQTYHPHRLWADGRV
jgi:hypothetical protein